jgi:F0F1-type ATP synthase membrane subunit b/b'
MAAQAAVFLAHAYAVKKLMLEPYLQIKQKQEAQTSGGEADAAKFLDEYERKTLSIEEKVASALRENSLMSSNIKDNARKEQQGLMDVARKASEEQLEDFRSELKLSLQEEKKKISAVTAQITEEVYKKILA